MLGKLKIVIIAQKKESEQRYTGKKYIKLKFATINYQYENRSSAPKLNQIKMVFCCSKKHSDYSPNENKIILKGNSLPKTIGSKMIYSKQMLCCALDRLWLFHFVFDILFSFNAGMHNLEKIIYGAHFKTG